MKQTFITTLPDKAGSFLEATRIVTGERANITRVSYNKAVDTHMLFLDVEGTDAALARVSQQLKALGYLTDGSSSAQVILLSFTLPDHSGALLPVLEIIARYRMNISYINSQEENGTGVQHFRMGLLTEDMAGMRRFIAEASAVCDVQVLSYDKSEQVMDNTVFYMTFVREIAARHHLSEDQRTALLADANLIMQCLEDHDAPPRKTFEYLAQFSEQIAAGRGENFLPRITRRELAGCSVTVIEPPTGSNTTILDLGSELLFVDSGFACYEQEMRDTLRPLFPDLDTRPKRLLLTHADIDHCGLMDRFDEVLMTTDAAEDFRREQEGNPCWRETDPIHAPYCRISKLLSGYRRPKLSTLRAVGGGRGDSDAPLTETGSFTAAGHVFRVVEGAGGHVRGEACYFCDDLQLAFSGDVYVNPRGFIERQSRFNLLAPYLMTSVNMDSKKASAERHAFVDMSRGYHVFCGHGAPIFSEGE